MADKGLEELQQTRNMELDGDFEKKYNDDRRFRQVDLSILPFPL